MATPRPEASPYQLIRCGTGETRSGVWWKYVQQGCALLFQAFQEAQAPSACTALIRRLYIDSVTYMLHGLPSDLSHEEHFRVHSAVPVMAGGAPTEDDRRDSALADDGNDARVHSSVQTGEERRSSWLEQATSSITYHAVTGSAFAIPFCRRFGMHCRQYDERHGISRAVEARFKLSAETVGQHGLRAMFAVWALKDRKVGKALKRTSKWWIKSCSRGV